MRRKLIILLIGLATFGIVRAAPGFPPGSLLEGPIVASDVAAQDRIELYDVGTGVTRELTFGANLRSGWLRVWDFSPDGCRILFTSSEGSAPASLYTARLDGGDLRELVHASSGSGAWEPQWGADRIAYTRIDTTSGNADIGGEHRIAWLKPDTGETDFYSVTGDEHTARWSPDGQRLVYISYEERPAGADTFSTADPNLSANAPTLREADLWVVNADGTNKFRLTNFPVGSVGMPRWSPDGDLIGFVYSPSANNDTFWMIGSAPNAVPTQLSFEWNLALDLTWLPDSTAMIASARNFQGVSENRLWHIPLVGNADTDAVPYLTDPALSYDDYPRFSADGQWLALRSEYALALYNTSDFSWQWISGSLLGNTPPVWSPAAFAGESACPT